MTNQNQQEQQQEVTLEDVRQSDNVAGGKGNIHATRQNTAIPTGNASAQKQGAVGARVAPQDDTKK